MKLLTTSNIRVGLWIKDKDYGLSKIIQVHKPVEMYKHETPFTYQIYNTHHYCYTSVTKTGFEYKKIILSKYKLVFEIILIELNEFFKKLI